MVILDVEIIAAFHEQCRNEGERWIVSVTQHSKQESHSMRFELRAGGDASHPQWTNINTVTSDRLIYGKAAMAIIQ